MTLAVGTRLGPYEILSPLGAGGMGEVYKARDTRLDRTVAIKVLPQHLAASPEVRQRFEREAKTISQLSHPHICALYDVGCEGETDYLVMEYLEGETFSNRLAKGPLPLEQTLRYGVEIADALDKAHRQGIVHRDLKPGNVMLTKSGIKLLDFGLAKLRQAGPGTLSSRLSALATEESPLTAEDAIVGTVQYMAPEQLEGKEADSRTDIFALGAVLYEIATGRKVFSGKSRASLIGAILKDEPAPISTIQPTIPPALDRLVKTCLAKDPEERWQSAGDVAKELRWIAEARPEAGVAAAASRRWERLFWAAGLAVLAALLVVSYLTRAPEPRGVIRFFVSAPPGSAFNSVGRDAGPVAVSPDGTRLAFVATTAEGKKHLFVRRLDGLGVELLAGTDGASYPFWSPDSRSLGFFAEGKLKRIEVSSGPIQTLCDAPLGRGGAWNREGVIVFAPGAYHDPLYRVSAAGGEAVPVTKLEEGSPEYSHRWPSFLPDGRHFVYLSFGIQRRSVFVGSLDSPGNTFLFRSSTLALFVPPGNLLFLRDGTLMALPFDPQRRRVSGEPVALAEKVQSYPNTASAVFSASSNGVLAYEADGSAPISQLVWFDRTGKRVGAVGPPGDCEDLRLSPDGRRVAVRLLDARTGSGSIWLYELDRGAATRFTFGLTSDEAPIWSPDASRLVFDSYTAKGLPDIYWKSTAGSGSEGILLESNSGKIPTDWSADGRFVVYQSRDQQTKWDLWRLPLFGDRKPVALLRTPFNETGAQVSPDGKWMAYTSDESGRREVYVTAFPGLGGKWQISTDGGSQPRWRRDSREIFYLAADRKLMAAEVRSSETFEPSPARPLFETHSRYTGNTTYDVSPDGQRFLINTVVIEQTPTPLTVVVNWTAALKK